MSLESASSEGSTAKLQRLPYLFAVLFLLVITVAFPSSEPRLKYISVLINSIVFGFWIFMRSRRRDALLLPKASLPFLGVLLLQTVLSTLSPIPASGMERALQGFAFFFLWLLVADLLRDRWDPGTWENALINTALVFSLIELGLAGIWYARWAQIQGTLFPLPPQSYRLSGLFIGHANVLAAFLNLVIPIVLVRILGSPGRSRRVFWIFTLVLFLATEYFASSRGGWISGTAAIIVTAVLSYMAVYGTDPRVLMKRLKDYGWSRSLLLLLGLLVLAFSFSMLVLRQSQSAPGHAPVSSARTGIWKPALTLFLRAPIWGHGPGSFPVLYSLERKLPPGFATSHAHNILLQIGVEIGALGLMLGAGMAFYVLRSFMRAWQRSSKTERWKLASYAGALAAFGLHHLVDFLLESPAYAASVVILLACIGHFAPRSERASLASRSAWAALGGLLLLQSAGVLYLARGSLSYWKGVEAGRAGRWEEAGESICRAAEVNTGMPLYRFQCGLAQAYVYFYDQDESALRTAQASISRGLALDPYWPVHWVNLAALQWQAGEPSEALESMQHAVESAPRNPHFQLFLAWMKADQGDLDGALRSVDQALDLDPWLEKSLVFQQEPFLDIGKATDPTASMSIREGHAFMGWQDLDRGQVDQAQAQFEQALSAGLGPPQAYAGLALVLGHQDDFTHAERLFMEAVFLHGARPDLLAAGSELAELRGDAEQASYLAEQAIRATIDQSYSQPYYSRTYLRYYLAPDMLPWMNQLLLPYELVDHLQEF